MPPHSPIEPEGTFDGLRPGAILLGAFADVAFTLLASWLLLAWLAPDVFEAGPEALRERIAELNASTPYIVGTLVGGALGTLFGGCVGALRAGQLFVRHGGWIAVTSAAFGALLMLGEGPPEDAALAFPLWAEALSWLLILPSGIAGGALAGAIAGARSRP